MCHDELQLREEDADLIEVHGILALARHGRAGDAGVDGDGQVELDTFGVDRVVDLVVRGQVEHEGRDAGEHDWMFLRDALKRSHRLHATARVKGRGEDEAVRVRFRKGEDVRRWILGGGGEDCLLDAGLIHGVD